MRDFLKHVSVEPSLLIFTLISDWIDGCNTNLYLQKTCRFNLTSEPDLNTECEDNPAGLLFVSEVNSKYRFTASFITQLFIVFATSWSDKAGRRRRPLIYMPIMGQILLSLSGCLNSYFWKWTPLTAVISNSIIESLNGGIGLMVVGSQIYVCDITEPKDRTMRLGFVGAILIVCLVLGKGGAGIILRNLGFFQSYLLCFVLSVISLIFGLIFIKDTSVPVPDKEPFYHVFNVKRSMSDNFKTVFNKKLGRRRVIVALLMVAYLAVNFTTFGELSVLYQYLNHRFHLDERQYSYFLFYRFSIGILGILICSVVLSKYLKIHDGLIGIVAGFFDTIAIVVLLLATHIRQIYLIPFLDIFHGTVSTICTSFMSKYYHTNELGRMNAVAGILCILYSASYPAYNVIFYNTINVFPSAFCLLSVVLNVIILLCFCFAYYLDKKIDQVNSANVPEEKNTMIVST
ncbi:lysosomal proton-coupled steroid conjugate and bile acid symporter SLC46A3-like [Planococcus citri]|uniref:lysosomal proton-coupled steroid conjugate and bile acid symporter SLC46A3-like n=1 Tax=Planococcus citri TaxID=170843 RepID=UPI0031F98537